MNQRAPQNTQYAINGRELTSDEAVLEALKAVREAEECARVAELAAGVALDAEREAREVEPPMYL